MNHASIARFPGLKTRTYDFKLHCMLPPRRNRKIVRVLGPHTYRAPLQSRGGVSQGGHPLDRALVKSIPEQKGWILL